MMSTMDLKDLAKAIEDLKRELRADNRSIKDSVQTCQDTLNECKNDTKELKALSTEVEDQRRHDAELGSSNQLLQQEVNSLAQYQRLNNLEIKGIPKDALDALSVVRKIGEVTSVKLEENDIDICHHVPTQKKDHHNIIVRMVSRLKRNKLLRKARKMRLTCSSLGLAGGDSRIFINEHLTLFNKQLMGAAVARKKAQHWKHLWTNTGKIFARKTDDSPVLHLKAKCDLDLMT